MYLLQLFRQQSDRSIRRLPARRRPLVEALEGRQLLSSFTVTADAIQGNHIGTNVSADVVGSHIGTNVLSDIVGNHIGTNVLSADVIVGKHIG
jgi:hypothetical protein